MPDPFILAAIAGAFLIAGTVKGIIGLPTVTLGRAQRDPRAQK